MKPWLVGLVLAASLACHHRVSDDDIPEMGAPPAEGSCAVKSDTVLVPDAVGASVVRWESSCLPEARLVYVDRGSWNVYAAGPNGEQPRCLTCAGDNVLGVDFPLDHDGKEPQVHWKGDPEVHPTLPIVFLKAENEHSEHRALRNSPSIGWDNDVWALDLCARRYTRLTRLAPGYGIQHSALSEDGAWYVYPWRYDFGDPPNDFGKARMVFNELKQDPATGELSLEPRFEAAPQGELYYEPLDVLTLGPGRYRLSYAAGAGTLMDAYFYEWSGPVPGSSRVLLETAALHEEFLMFSPSGKRLVWMRGPLVGLGYRADLFVSSAELTDVRRLTYYNNCNVWPDKCSDGGAQLSRLEWSEDGRAVYFGLWIHGGPLQPFRRAELHRLDFAGPCGAE